MKHTYRRSLRGNSVQYVCECGWRSSRVGRHDDRAAYAQWQGHRDLARYGPKS